MSIADDPAIPASVARLIGEEMSRILGDARALVLPDRDPWGAP
jgi:hypothetical protein